MNSFISQRGFPWKFFLLVFVLSIPFWLLGAWFENRLPLPVNLPSSAFMFVIPSVVALILSYKQSGWNGIRQLAKRAFDFKKIKNRIWFAPMLLLIPLVYFLSFVIMRLIGVPLPEPNTPFFMTPIFFLLFFISAMGEELGWTGYAIDPMQNRLGALGAAIVLGIIWQVWHIIPDLQAQHTPVWIVWHSLYSIGLRILIVWIYNNTAQSVFAAILVHTTDNVSWTLFPNYGSAYDPFYTCILAWLAAAAVIFLWGPATLARYKFACIVAIKNR